MRRTLLAAIAVVAFVCSMAFAQNQAAPVKAKAPQSSAAKARAGKAGSGQAASSEKLDINTATKEQLEALPGIGPATSQKIIAGRPYKAKNDLVKKNIVGQKEYDKIKDQIIAHQVASSKLKKPTEPKK